jgi:hypothetical protein
MTRQSATWEATGGQSFTYDLFDSLKLSEFERRGPWFAESSGSPFLFHNSWAARLFDSNDPSRTQAM